MLTKKQFDDLWDEFKKAMPKGNMLDYDEYIDSENAYSGGNCATHSGDTVPPIPVI